MIDDAFDDAYDDAVDSCYDAVDACDDCDDVEDAYDNAEDAYDDGEEGRFCVSARGADIQDMSQLLLLGKFEYGGGPIFKEVLEC